MRFRILVVCVVIVGIVFGVVIVIFDFLLKEFVLLEFVQVGSWMF